MGLAEEIEIKAKEIQTDSYSMSIGELINMYRDGEIQIQPDFQRLFRWNNVQKARFIESILLGIPIPPIFVAQSKGGIWDVIDGLQRLSTIFEFVGILKDPNNVTLPPSVLVGTKFLPSLQGKMWNNPEKPEDSFTDEQRIDFKRAKMDINIIKRTSDSDAKYELFQRLNTGGSQLSDQEIRNCLMIMINKEFYTHTIEMRNYPPFQNCLPLTEKQYSVQEDMEYLIRFLVYRYIDVNRIKGDEDIGEFLTEKMVSILEDENYDIEKEKEIFKKTFDLLDQLFFEDAFRRYDHEKGKFVGPISISAFEAIIYGLSNNIDELSKQSEIVEEKVKEIYRGEKFLEATKRGTRPINRLKKLTELSKEVFS